MHGKPTATMRSELIDAGVGELLTAQDVESYFSTPKTTLLVFNSVCGCAAGSARPGIIKALANHPMGSVSVFAGLDSEATAKARALFSAYAPSSPSCLLIKEGKAVYQLLREDIMGHTPSEVAEQLSVAFSTHL